MLLSSQSFGSTKKCQETFSAVVDRLLAQSDEAKLNPASIIKWKNSSIQSHTIRSPKIKGPKEKIVRYVSESEAKEILRIKGFSPKLGHKNPKWVGETGTVNPKTLGKPKNYSYKIEVELEPGTTSWLKKFEVKPSSEPNRYAIPKPRLDQFNDNILNIKIEKIR
jgi:hypothetical protein